MIYTGIGSRETPPEVLQQMTKIAYWLAGQGHTLRSGKAGGADAAFQSGVEWFCYNNQIQPTTRHAEIYVPWSGFGEGLWSCWDVVGGNDQNARNVAMQIHPAWSRCKQGAQKLHTRNVMQILGRHINRPSDLVLFYAPEDALGNVKGGTATAVKLARLHGVTTINMAQQTWAEQLRKFLGV